MKNSPQTILLVEDDVIIAENEVLQLKKAGYSVLCASSGKEAIELFKNHPSIDLVLMDIDLGENMDGTEVAKRILEIRDVPIVFLTAHTEPEIVAKTEKITSYGIVDKASGEAIMCASVRMAQKLSQAQSILERKNAALNVANKELETVGSALKIALDAVDASQKELYKSYEEIILRQKILDFERQQLLSIFDAIPESIYACDMDTYEILYVNKTLCEQLGYDPLGKVCYREFQNNDAPCSFCTNEILRKNPDHPYYWEFYNKKLNRHYAITDCIITWPDGRKVRLEVARDITEIKKIEEILRNREKMMRALLNASFESMYLLTTDGTIILANEIGAARLGMKSEQIIGRNVFDLLVKEKQDEFRVYSDLFLEKKSPMRFTSEYGGSLYEISLYPVFSEEQQIEYVAIFAADITEKKRIEDELRQSEAKYRAIVEHASEAIVIAFQEKLVYVNPKTVELIGYDAEYLCSKPFVEFIHPDDREMVFANYSRRIKGEQAPSVYEFRVIHRTGEIRHVEVHPAVIPWKGGIATLNLLSDITTRKQIEKELIEQKQLFETLLEALPYPVFYKDTEGKYIGCNRAFAVFLGLPREDIVGKTVFEIAPKELAQIYYEADELLLKNPGYQRYEAKVRTPMGDRDVVFHKATFYLRDGSLGGIVGTIIDITDQRKAEEKLLYASQIADINRERAEKLLEEKEMLLKEVHHRIKNNLSTVMGLLSLQINSLHTEEAKAALTDARNRVQSIAVLYDKLYTTKYYKQMPLSEYLADLVHEIVSLYPHGNSIQMKIAVPPVELSLKKIMPLGIIINEFITNSMKYAFKEKEKGTIIIEGYEENNKIILSVSDDGPGIPDDALKEKKGFGFELISILVKQLKGTVNIRPKEGAKIIIEFNKD